jgi:hypothetical protein
MRHTPLACLAALGLSLAPSASRATVVFDFIGTTPDTLVDVKFEAALTIAGDTLTVVLTNDSASLPSSTLNPADLLTSFYFDIVDGSNQRPTLSYVSATGDVYTGDRDGPDPLTAAGADLLADSPGDRSWQFKQGLALPAGSSLLTFGIGTAGNSSLSPNGFNGNIVGGLDYGIYAGDVTSSTLDGDRLVKTSATFTFSGVAGFDEADVSESVLFGLGTKPDSTALVPEPAAALLLGAGLLGFALAGRSRRS